METICQEARQFEVSNTCSRRQSRQGMLASHLRSLGKGIAITNCENRPRRHQEHLAWPPSRILSWAGTIGPNTARVVERNMEDKPHPEMGYRACLGVIRLAKKYSNERLEAAAMRGLLTEAWRYRSIESILKNSLDQHSPEASTDLTPPSTYDNIRGAEYGDQGEAAC